MSSSPIASDELLKQMKLELEKSGVGLDEWRENCDVELGNFEMKVGFLSSPFLFHLTSFDRLLDCVTTKERLMLGNGQLWCANPQILMTKMQFGLIIYMAYKYVYLILHTNMLK
jgi:hypothetical protein